MALTPSTMMPIGTRAPDFELPDTVSGKTVKLSDFAKKKALLVMFICNHCPYVIHVRDGLVKLGKDYETKDVAIVAISANDPRTHPDDAPDKLGAESKRLGYRFPVLFDESQDVAKAYRAACTPDFFLFDEKQKLVYRGQFDGSRPGNNVLVTGSDLRSAIEAVLAGKPLAKEQKPSLG
ncbi:MAG: thioredoxin family protein, partial [Planctomycetota bacterium]